MAAVPDTAKKDFACFQSVWEEYIGDIPGGDSSDSYVVCSLLLHQ